MTAKKDQKALIRERMAKTGESYMAARRQLVPAETAPSRTAGAAEALDWRMLRILTQTLSELLAEMEAGACFYLAPPTDDALAPSEGSLLLKDEWRLALVSTTVALAKQLHLGAEVDGIPGDTLHFRWASPDNLGKNAYVRAAKKLLPVAKRLIAAEEAAD